MINVSLESTQLTELIQSILFISGIIVGVGAGIGYLWGVSDR